jgi:hypothetical protein
MPKARTRKPAISCAQFLSLGFIDTGVVQV